MAVLVSFVQRLAEIIVGLLAIVIGALTLWMCYQALLPSSDLIVSKPTLWAIIYVLANVAIAALLFGARLIVPRLRVEGGHVIGLRGLVVFAFLYGLTIVVGIVSGGALSAKLVLGLGVVFSVVVLIRERLASRVRE